MFNVRPNLRIPGFNVREPDEEVPGFRLNADGTIGKPPTTSAKPDGNPFDIFEPQPWLPGHRRTSPLIPTPWPTRHSLGVANHKCRGT